MFLKAKVCETFAVEGPRKTYCLPRVTVNNQLPSVKVK